LSPSIIAEKVLETMKDSLIVVNQKGDIVNTNKSTLDLLSYKKNEILNMKLNQIITLPGLEKNERENIFGLKIFNKKLNTMKQEDTEVEFIHKNGKIIPMNVTTSSMYEDGNLVGMVLVARDLTEIKKTIREKDVLLREIHHRVKNNLQLISSLLDLQSMHVRNKNVKEIFGESQNRIKLMARLHDQLYQSKDLANINFHEYIQNLANNLFCSYNINPNSILIKINIPDIFMDVDTTLTCGLIINELVVNSLKHAFSTTKKGEIILDFQPKNGIYSLIVSDNGIGFPKKVDFRKTKTLGLQLVNMLVLQLEGNIELEKSQGTKFIITFQLFNNKKGGKNDRRKNLSS
jgi:PAS domain S-box-containing protein